MSDDITHWTLVQAADAIRNGELSARDLTLACIERIEAHREVLNCFIHFTPEAALAQAEQADRKQAAGEPLGLLHGVPLAHKDMFYRQGIATSCGSKIRADFKPAYTATVIERLQSAGAIHLGGLNMAEFAFGPTGHNHHYGAVRNPWHTARITGGSSSGSGAATAARLVFGALGSDTGGSVRLPAAACGLVGMKPTQTRVSRYGVMGLSFSLDCVGPLARTSADCARLLGIIAGHDHNDPSSAQHALPDYEAATRTPAVRGLRIGVPEVSFATEMAADVAAALAASQAVLTDLGAELVPLTLPDLAPIAGLANALQSAEAATLHNAWLRERPQDYGPQVRARIELGLGVTATQYLSAAQARPGVIRRFVDDVFSRCDVLQVPAIPIPLPTIADADIEDTPGFAELLASLSSCTRPFNYLALPALSVPAGFSDDGLPVAFQLVGRPFAEADLFKVSAAYESATNWAERAPALGAVS